MLDLVNGSPEAGMSRVSRLPVHMAMVSEWDLEQIFAVIKRRRRLIGLCVLGFFALASIYLVVAAPRYTATVDLLLDTPRVAAVADSYDANSAIGFETGGIDSQVELLKSERIALGVIRKRDLKNNPAFAPKPSIVMSAVSSSVSWVLDFFGSSDINAQDAIVEADRALERRIIKSLYDNVDIKRIGRTYVLELKYKNGDPGLAAQVANTYAEQYLVDQLDAKYDATTRAAVWLQDRIAELREKSLAADTKVQKFRTERGLIAVDGRLVDEQALADANAQLSDARAKMAEAEAKSQRIDTILGSGVFDAAVNESLANPVIATLRTKYLEAAKREADISKKLGPDHIAATNLRADMKEYERQLFDELKRIGESYRSDFQISKSRLESIEQNFKTRKAQTGANNEVLVQLRDLMRESDTYKTLYETFLQRYQSAIQQQSFPINDARIITAATPPLEPSWPKMPLVMGLGLVLGALTGVGAAMMVELRDRVFRTGDQVQSVLGLEFLGLIPWLDIGAVPTNKETSAPGVLGGISPMMAYSISSPLSGFAETLRATKVSADIALRGKKPKIIGIVSVMPSEGKTTVSKNFASLISNLGHKTILIDADLRNPGLSRALAPYAADGLIELLKGSKSLKEIGLVEAASGLTMVPAVVHRRTTNSSELLSSETMRKLLADLGGEFDYIVLDLPPLGPVIDVRASADLIDAFVFVVEWGKTSRDLVKATLEAEPEVAEKCLGVVLNKTDQSKLKLYMGSEYRNYYYSKYSKYYTA